MDGTWKDDKEYGILEFWLENGTIFVLHPDDEQPKRRATQKFLSQYQHGNVHVTDWLSLSLVFRVVTSKAKVCVVDNRKELQEKDKVRFEKKMHYYTKRERGLWRITMTLPFKNSSIPRVCRSSISGHSSGTKWPSGDGNTNYNTYCNTYYSLIESPIARDCDLDGKALG
jgi:hypothetical protein